MEDVSKKLINKMSLLLKAQLQQTELLVCNQREASSKTEKPLAASSQSQGEYEEDRLETREKTNLSVEEKKPKPQS